MFAFDGPGRSGTLAGPPTMASGETAAHRELKRLALRWAKAEGYDVAAAEVRVPRSGYRADVAAWRQGRGDTPSRTIICECKQSRADLLGDARPDEATRARLRGLLGRRDHLEELLGGHRPDLRRGESLFAEFDSFDFSGLRHDTYAAVTEEIATCQRRLLDGLKFERLRRYQPADLLYLVTEPCLAAAEEIPAGWGLLEREGSGLVLRRPPLRLQPADAARHDLLVRIARAATREVFRSTGGTGN